MASDPPLAHCSPSPCVRGTCVDESDSFTCDCDPGWAGPLCGQDVDECADDPCLNGTCIDGVASFTCECEPGWEGPLCDANVDECAGDPCLNGTCIDGVGSFTCECEPGWEGPLCDTNVDECAGDPCLNGTCVDGIANFTCECEPGWEGPLCESDVDECASEPCVHGTCIDEVASFECECEDGWEGTLCDIDVDDCDPAPCIHGTCQDGIDSFECDCEPGWEGSLCDLDIDECATSPCANGTCVDAVATFECECAPGWEGTACDVDIDECAGDPCAHGDCIDGIDAFTCACEPGWEGTLCDVDIDECAAEPCAQGTCVDGVAAYQCVCHPGWEGPLCDSDIDDCAGASCANGACVDGIDEYTCECEDGWAGPLCEVDIDECAEQPCVNGSCIDRVAGFDCECDDGWTAPLCDQDVDECAGEPCAHGTCDNQDGGFECLCEPRWDGPLCDQCEPQFAGPDCSQCATPYAGEACDECQTGFVGEACDYCDTGYAGGSCTPCTEPHSGFGCRFRRLEPQEGEPVVIDVITQQMWLGCDVGRFGVECDQGESSKLTWQEAGGACSDLTWGSFSDWRRPSHGTLMELGDAHWGYPDQPYATMDPAAFPNAAGYYWSNEYNFNFQPEAAVVSIDNNAGEATYYFFSINSTSAAQCGRSARWTLISGPEGWDANASPTLSFATDADVSATYECALDQGEFAPCENPLTLTDLPEGFHTISVRATDTYGVTDPTPALLNWRVDTIPPETDFDVAPLSSVTLPVASFEFSATDASAVTFECVVDGGLPVPCASPHLVTDLSDGEHTFEVYAIDRAGNVDDTPAMAAFSVAFCGNGTVGPGEACDDGNFTGGDYCSSDCTEVTGSCGDGLLQGNEDCEVDVPCTALGPAFVGGQAPCAACQADRSECERKTLFEQGVHLTIAEGLHPVRTVAVGDMNGDGALDVLTASLPNPNHVARWHDNVGDQGLWPMHTVDGGAYHAIDVLPTDLDDDSDLDVVVVTKTTYALHLNWNTEAPSAYEGDGSIFGSPGDGSVFERMTFKVSCRRDFATGDVDGDLDQDIVIASDCADELAWWEIDWILHPTYETPWFTLKKHVIANDIEPAVAVDLADFDADGDLDIAIARDEAQTVDWYGNDGAGGFTHVVVADLATPTEIHAADVNGDGRPDIVAAGDTALRWYRDVAGNGSDWVEQQISPEVDEPRRVVTADLDGDGDLDVVTVSSAGVRWHENVEGDGTVWSDTVVDVEQYDVAVGDVDGDGDPDLLVARKDGTVGWYPNLLIP